MFDPDERAQFFSRLSETLNQYDDSLNGNGNDNGYNAARRPSMRMNEQARAMRRNGNGGRAAMDSAARHHYSGGSFFDRFPEARSIRVLG